MSSLSGALDESVLNRSVGAADDVEMLPKSVNSASDSGEDEEMSDLFGQDDVVSKAKPADRFAQYPMLMAKYPQPPQQPSFAHSLGTRVRQVTIPRARTPTGARV